MPIALAIALGLVGVFIGALGGLYMLQRGQKRVVNAERDAARILSEADRRQKELLLEAKEEAIRTRQQAESELRDRRKEVQRSEQRLNQKEENLDRKLESLEQRQRNLQNKERDLEQARASLATLEDERREELERLSNLTVGEAREMLLAQIEREIRDEANRRLREIEQEVKEEADERARKIIAVTMQRLTSEVVSETTVSVVPLPSEDMKGRIIGREGRNIRSLEHLTGVDVIIDDTPDARDPFGVRSGAPRSRQDCAYETTNRRAHPPGAYRGDGGEGTQRGRGIDQGSGRGGRYRGRGSRDASRDKPGLWPPHTT